MRIRARRSGYSLGRFFYSRFDLLGNEVRFCFKEEKVSWCFFLYGRLGCGWEGKGFLGVCSVCGLNFW